MKIIGLKKCKIVALLLASIILNQVSFAGQLVNDNGVRRYIDDNGMFAIGWRWLDLNDDGICECYRFNYDGSLVATCTNVNGKEVNERGEWVVDGVVQRVFKNTGRPLYATNVNHAFKDTNEYIDFGTNSEIKGRRINSTKLDIKAMMERDANSATESYLKSLLGPNGTFEPPKEGYLLSKGAKKINKKVPIATQSTWHIIDDAIQEETIRVLSASESIVAGRDVRGFVTASSKYTAKVNNVKIYGGATWSDAIMLQGNGAYMKCTTTSTNKRFKANYFTAEIAHQTHGESTADTYCAVELYINGKSVESYDSFCDDAPEKIEIWLDDNETTIELRAIVTGDAPGRKIYIRNARFRQLREKKEDK